MEQEPIHSPFTCDTFLPYVGQTFSVDYGVEGDILELVLVEAKMQELKDYDGRALGRSGNVRRDPFALLFRGPEGGVEGQGHCTFTHPLMGSFPLFIVYVGLGQTGMMYQAVFN